MNRHSSRKVYSLEIEIPKNGKSTQTAVPREIALLGNIPAVPSWTGLKYKELRDYPIFKKMLNHLKEHNTTLMKEGAEF